VAQIAALVERFDLIGGEIALFGGKKVVCHQYLRRGLRSLASRPNTLIESQGHLDAPVPRGVE
jgi:hypothetical protein